MTRCTTAGNRRAQGFTLIEVIIAVLILGILVAIALPSYTKMSDESDKTDAILDIQQIEVAIKQYQLLNNGKLPDTLADVGWTANDPWGNPYEYTNFDNVKGNGKKRKDKNLVPINSDYDLFSKGEDGQSVGPLTAKPSRDDIVRANNGSYIGLAEDY